MCVCVCDSLDHFLKECASVNLYTIKNAISYKYYRISYYIKINLKENHYSKSFDDKAIISCKKLQLEEKKWLKSVHNQGNWALVVQTDI